jgi:D-proline reductase (dithiol) PrdB
MNPIVTVPAKEGHFIPWTPWLRSAAESKIALITVGGVYMKHGLHEPFQGPDDPTFREFPHVVNTEDLALAEGQVDSPWAAQDLNVLFPLERLRDLAATGYIGSVAPFAYAFAAGSPDLGALLPEAGLSVAYRMRRMGPDAVLLVATTPESHRTAAHLARLIETVGIPTVILGTTAEPFEAIGVPRAVLVEHPAGAPLGNPGNAGKHGHLIQEALSAAWELEGPGLLIPLPFRWQGA